MWEQNPQSGDEVTYMSGESLGQIDAVRKGDFRVVTADGQFWLSPDVIFTRQGQRVTLVCEASGLHRFTPEASRSVRDQHERVRAGFAR